MSTLNLGILAHVDAGKTSLTERLLFAAGVIDAIGRVDTGNTQTDTLALEQRRGITIKSAVVSFTLAGRTVNLIDTPGHPDFIAEVERVLCVLDGAVLVLSAVEGVQAQTRILMRTLQRLRIPTLIFVNKIDRSGARHREVLEEIANSLSREIVPMGEPIRPGTPQPGFRPYAMDAGEFTELLTRHDDELLAAYVQVGALPPDRLRAALAEQTRACQVHPVYFGSAITGTGVDALADGIAELLPPAAGHPDAAASGTVFKIERGPTGEKVAYVRMFTGAVHVRDRLPHGRITALRVFERGTTVQRNRLEAGHIGKVWGLGEVRIGDAIGGFDAGSRRYFAAPSLETVVVPCHDTERGALRVALDQLSEQDPLIDVRQDDVRQELFVSLYGEVQKEVVQATLAEEYGLAVTFRDTTTICIERPDGTGAAVEFMADEGNPFLATVGLCIEPTPIGSGIRFRVATEVLGTMPPAFFRAVEDTVHQALGQGLHGWQVTDCLVTMTHTGYAPRQSHAHQGFDKSMSSTGGDFRGLTPLVVMAALKRAGTIVYEPMERFRVEAPADTFGSLLPALSKVGAVPEAPVARGSSYTVEGDIPVAQVHRLRQQLPGLTRGEGVLESAFSHHRPVRAVPPERSRIDDNPLDRKEYLLHVQRRV